MIQLKTKWKIGQPNTQKLLLYMWEDMYQRENNVKWKLCLPDPTSSIVCLEPLYPLNPWGQN